MIRVRHQGPVQVGADVLGRHFGAHSAARGRGLYFGCINFSHQRSPFANPELPAPRRHSWARMSAFTDICNQWPAGGFLLSLTTPPTTTLQPGSDIALLATPDSSGCSLPEAQALLSALAEPNR